MKFYVTTPIYYVNDQPHIGHAYTSVAADTLARYNRMRRRPVFFLTGTDEHGQKVEAAAAGRGLAPLAHADLMVENFRSLWRTLGLSHDAFIRTTDAEHQGVVRELLMRLYDKGEIVKRSYSGWYCTPCERFWTEKDLGAGGICPDCGRPVEKIEEENYFFVMSRYHERLARHIEGNPSYILPETRRNEVLGFLRTQPLGDLCISRPKQRLSWGIPLPFDDRFVTYVWFDALINYYSATTYLAPEGPEPWWPADVHIIGKDILTTHAVYWSTMLMALGLPLPRTVFAHGWWTVEGRKMSKSLGNVVDPRAVAATYGSDAFRYFLLREIAFGLDGDFAEDALIRRINTDLANDLGNLASRTFKMAAQYFQGIVPQAKGDPVLRARAGSVQAGDPLAVDIRALAEGIPEKVEAAMRGLQFGHALDEIWKLVSCMNKYIESEAPWALAKDPSKRDELSTVIYSSLEALRFLAVVLHPFIPVATERLYRSLGFSEGLSGIDPASAFKWGGLVPGTPVGDPGALFPRIEARETGALAPSQPKEKHTPMPTTTPESTTPEGPRSADNLIAIDEFAKVELKTGRVLAAERVPKSKKLIRMDVDTGETRQVVAGIGAAYAPEDLVGKTVVVVTNLRPAKLMGVESHGMLLAATDASGVPVLLTTSAPVAPGAGIR
jgi:methionyl-tRNA synthetase